MRVLSVIVLVVVAFFVGFIGAYFLLERKLPFAVLDRNAGDTGSEDYTYKTIPSRNHSLVAETERASDRKNRQNFSLLKAKEPDSSFRSSSFKPALGGPFYVAIIIDDMGDSVEKAKLFASLPVDVTLSIIPYLPHDRDTANIAKSYGKSYMVHIPMEADTNSYEIINIEMRTKKLLRVTMDRDAIAVVVNDMLNRLNGAVAANNHMGSLFTSREDKMEPVLELIKERGLFFVDSLTTSKSKVCEAARAVGVGVLRRNVFLDNKADVNSIKEQIKLLVNTAKRRGYAIGIGHPNKATYEAIKEMIPYIESNGVKVVSVDKLYEIVRGDKDEGCF